MSNVGEREMGIGPARKRISWGAIIAGAILVLVIQIMLGLLGVGIGLATLDPAGSDNPGAGSLMSVGGLWAVGTVLVATFAGGYAAARFAGSYVKRDAALHGITTWAVSTLVAVYLLTSGVSTVVTGAFGALGGTVQSLTQAAGSLVPGSVEALPEGLQAEAEQLLARGQQQAGQAAQAVQDTAQNAAQTAQQATGTQNLGAAVREIFRGLQEGATPEERQAAVSVIASQAGIPEAEAEQRLTEFQGQYDEAVAQAREAAATAAETASTTAFGTFVAMLLGLIVGALGGLAGRPARVHPLYRD